MKQWNVFLLSACALWLAQCAGNSAGALSTPDRNPGSARTVTVTAAAGTGVRSAQPVFTTIPNAGAVAPGTGATAAPPTHGDEPTLEPTANGAMRMPTATRAVTALANVLQVAEAEMRAAQSARTLVEAHAHAETAVNLLVGEFGRWYGDQDGDGNRHVPFDTRGALPGELNPQGGGADGGAPPPSNAGLVLLAAGTTVNSPALTALLGDVGLWRAQPRRGYDDIASAVAAGSPDGAGLTGNVPRAVAAGRLVILARSMPEVDAFAASGLDALAQALQAAQAMQ